MRNLELLLNKNCNMNCQYCGIVDNTIKELTSEQKRSKFIEILDEDFKECYILGGEPSINADFDFVIQELQKRNIETFVYSNSTIKKDNEYNLIISYHKNDMPLKSFINNVKKLKNVKIIKVMWSKDMDSLMDYKIIKGTFDVPVYLEPIFDVICTGMDMSSFEKAIELGVSKYSEIMNIENKYLNRSISDLLMNDVHRPKICEVQKYTLTYDFQDMNSYRCLTDCMQKYKTTDELCTNNHCLCDIDKVKELL